MVEHPGGFQAQWYVINNAENA